MSSSTRSTRSSTSKRKFTSPVKKGEKALSDAEQKTPKKSTFEALGAQEELFSTPKKARLFVTKPEEETSIAKRPKNGP